MILDFLWMFFKNLKQLVLLKEFALVINSSQAAKGVLLRKLLSQCTAKHLKLIQNNRYYLMTPQSITVARYHSLIVDCDSLPKNFQITALSEEGEIMAIENEEANIYGIQFHPESFLGIGGDKIIKNFLTIAQNSL